MDKVFIVVRDEVYDLERTPARWVYAKEEDAIAKVKEESDRVRADWANECLEEDDYHFSAWRNGEWSYYHCEIYYDEQEVL